MILHLEKLSSLKILLKLVFSIKHSIENYVDMPMTSKTFTHKQFHVKENKENLEKFKEMQIRFHRVLGNLIAKFRA